MTATAAVLPVKSFGRAKSRLGGWPDRPALAAAMAADVLATLSAVDGLSEIVLVSREPAALTDDPGGHGAALVRVVDEPEAGHVAAARLGIRTAVARGAERVLLVPGDCPALAAGELEELLAAGEQVVVVPDRHGTGTNALLLAPPTVIAPSFGPGSFRRHTQAALAAGASLRVARPPSLLLDVDTPDDLEALQAALAPGAAPNTRALLPLRA